MAGFEMEFCRNFDIDHTRTRPNPPIEIGVVSAQNIVDVPREAGYYKDDKPQG
jgi:hypothetical protein